MMGLDLDEILKQPLQSLIRNSQWYNPIRFVESDYLAEKRKMSAADEPKSLKQRIASKVQQLAGFGLNQTVWRCWLSAAAGTDFSLINCFFCYDETGDCRYMLAEVSNTPWRERHSLSHRHAQRVESKKSFTFPPFMDLDMNYLWK